MIKAALIFAGWLIDGTGKPTLKNAMIKIKQGTVVKIVKSDAKLKMPFHKTETGCADYSDYTILPSLVDCHVHLSMSGTQDLKVRQHQLEANFEQIKPVIDAHICDHLSYGIAAVRDGGDHLGHAMRYRTQCFDSQKMPFHMKVAGKAWNRQGRYGKLIGRSPRKGETLAGAIEKELLELYPMRPDHIKIVNSGINSLKHFGKQTLPQFSLEEMKEAVNVAADHDLPVMVHANGYEPVKIAVKSGCRSIEHGFFIGEDNLKRMADYGTYWVPTACTMKAYADTLQPGSPEAFAARKYLEHQLNQMDLAKKVGVQMAVGTDSGSMGVNHGHAIIEELKLFMKAGFSLEQALGCSSKNGARLLGMENSGHFSVSKSVSFFAVNGSPEHFFENLEKKLILTDLGVIG